MKSRIIGILLSLVLALLQPRQVLATTIELVVSGNGSGSESEVEISRETEVVVEQTNDVSVTNVINVSANTGNNSANGNTGGDVEIITGDVSVQTVVETKANDSQVEINNDCCEEDNVVALISGNGESSQNQVKHQGDSTVKVAVEQKAKVTNVIKTEANTGDNSASKNNGKVKVETGDVKILSLVKNTTNSSLVEVNDCCEGTNTTLKIVANGTESQNIINNQSQRTVDIVQKNQMDIDNVLNINANSGRNRLDKNLGNVDLYTGDVVILTEVITVGNLNDVIICPDCQDKPDNGNGDDDDDQDDDGNGDGDGDDDGEEEEDQEKPKPHTPPEKTSGKSKSKSKTINNDISRGGPGDVLGTSDGKVLPITGGSMSSMLLLIANILMFLFGIYIRRLSGRAPAKI
jgi:hypothetical protein